MAKKQFQLSSDGMNPRNQVIPRWPDFGGHDVIILVFVICSYDEWKTKHNLIPESHDERSNSKHDR